MGVHGSYKKMPNDRLCGNRYMKHKNLERAKTVIKEPQREKYMKTTSRYSNKEEFDKWVEISTNQQSEETIREALLEDQYSVCISFLCKYQKFSEDFLEELIWITSRIFDKDTYNKDIINLLIKFTDEYHTIDERIEALDRIRDYNIGTPIEPALTKEEKKYLIFTNYRVSDNKPLATKLLEMYRDTNSRDRMERMDWSELNSWNLSDKFRSKYSEEFENIKKIYSYNYKDE